MTSGDAATRVAKGGTSIRPSVYFESPKQIALRLLYGETDVEGDFMKVAIGTINGYYLTAVNGGGIGDPTAVGIPILTTSTTIGPNETFTLQQGVRGAGTLAIQCPNGVNFLNAVNGGGMSSPAGGIPSPIVTTEQTIGVNETFVLVPSPAGQPGQYAIQTASGNYLTAVGGGGIGDPGGTSLNTYPIHTDAPAISLWETMTFIIVALP